MCYYGGQIIDTAEAEARCPVMMHFGTQDTGIPMSDVDTIRGHQPKVAFHIYEAGHGFNCDQRGSWNEAAAAVALERTLGFFTKHVG